MPASPSTDNYYIGKGTITVQAAGETTPRDIGNVPEFEFTASIETLDHFSSRAGVRSKDKSIVLEKGGQLRLVMEEVTAENLSLAVAGTVTTNTATNKVIDILSANALEVAVVFTGTNEVGQKINATFPKVSFAPNGSFGFISDEWGQLEVTGEVLYDTVTSSFGTWELVEQA